MKGYAARSSPRKIELPTKKLDQLLGNQGMRYRVVQMIDNLNRELQASIERTTSIEDPAYELFSKFHDEHPEELRELKEKIGADSLCEAFDYAVKAGPMFDATAYLLDRLAHARVPAQSSHPTIRPIANTETLPELTAQSSAPHQTMDSCVEEDEAPQEIDVAHLSSAEISSTIRDAICKFSERRRVGVGTLLQPEPLQEIEMAVRRGESLMKSIATVYDRLFQ